MDEATSALDVATERQVLRSILEHCPDKTCIVTTHRPTVIGLCERVYQVGGGTVRELGKQEAQFAQQFSRVRFRRRYSTADVKLADVEKLFPTLADGSHGKELAFMTGVCRSKWGIRGAMSVYTNAVRNENTSLDGLRGIAASMGVGVLS